MKKSSSADPSLKAFQASKVQMILDQDEIYDQFVKFPGNHSGNEDGSETRSLTGIPNKKHFVPKKINQSKETLYMENLELKEKIHDLNDEKVKLSTQIDYLNKKLSETTKIIAEVAKKSKSPLHKYLRMTEQLKNSVQAAQNDIKLKEEELKHIKKDLRYSQIHELKQELDAYKAECLRLQSMIKESSGQEGELEAKIKSQILLFEELQKENRKIREKLEKVINDEKNFSNNQEEVQLKSSQFSKKHKRKLAKLVDENLKLKNRFVEKSRELSEFEIASKSEISYLRRKVEELEAQAVQLKLEGQKNEYFKIFYECRFHAFEITQGDAVFVKKQKRNRMTNNKACQTKKKLEKCKKCEEATKKISQSTQTKKKSKENLQKNSGIQVELLKDNKKSKKQDLRCESIDLQPENSWVFKQNTEKVQDFEEFEIVIPKKTFFPDEEQDIKSEKDQKQLKPLKKNTIFYERSDHAIQKQETLIKPRILNLSKERPEEKAELFLQPKIPSLKLTSAKLSAVNLFSKMLKAPKSVKSSGKIKALRKNLTFSGLRIEKQSSEMKKSNSFNYLNDSKKFSSVDIKESKDIILDDVMYNKIYEDSLHSSDYSGIFVNENPLSSFHPAEKKYNISNSRRSSINRSVCSEKAK